MKSIEKKRGLTLTKRSSFAEWVKERSVTLALMGVMLLGICLIGYPSFADYWNNMNQISNVMSYAEKVASMTTEDYDRIMEEAREYNERLAAKGIDWNMTDAERIEYNSMLDFGETGIMGYIRIVKIGIMLPIYHGTSETILQTSIGHLEQSSLPIGGESTHSMLSGHRGLPSAKLFSDLDKLVEGDTFTVTILNETTTYEVDHIWIVEPNDMSHLTIEPGKDYCTLITCTPYGVNSHRLLVRAHRIDNVNGDAKVVADAIQIRPVYIAPFFSIPILIILLIYVLITTSAKRRQKKNYVAEYLKQYGVKEAVVVLDDKDIILEALQNFVKTKGKK